VIRDFPKAAMGLIDYANQPKHAVEDRSFHGDRMILLQTDMDRRSFQCPAWIGSCIAECSRCPMMPGDFGRIMRSKV
jgi:hypothetical protein